MAIQRGQRRMPRIRGVRRRPHFGIFPIQAGEALAEPSDESEFFCFPGNWHMPACRISIWTSPQGGSFVWAPRTGGTGAPPVQSWLEGPWMVNRGPFSCQRTGGDARPSQCEAPAKTTGSWGRAPSRQSESGPDGPGVQADAVLLDSLWLGQAVFDPNGSKTGKGSPIPEKSSRTG